MEIEFTGELWFWRGPAPWHFLTVPAPECRALDAIRASVTYGWGMVPAEAQIGDTRWTTSLFPRDGRYLVPVKTWVRRAEGVELGDEVRIRLDVDD